MSALAPFDASLYAYRTNFDGLTPRDPASAARVEQAVQPYQDALEKFGMQDERARERYEQDTNDGLTTDKFEHWVINNVPQWAQARAELGNYGAALSQAAFQAFGDDYHRKISQGQQDLMIAARQAGCDPQYF
ncbi:hypothetical protein ANOM_000188 [Aspergillus nomiae NRRL 13137]|uniref:Uncharacterized protein n=1 Tax=Aspergillus nomiae NRRL (strain ATCC 15546 / NRRL 13137 / CBS 260.88 / M93) TaxID=1509407 RepID=A0A0L1JJJ6_ASPN3|nr:uncharacterized protein ANOM_000188 [Aspergillus nomiae NRRL 13137]KNG91588.1 hypothetical protein ANOM_000188 [Aspergillus nomiae NRRL 13137]